MKTWEAGLREWIQRHILALACLAVFALGVFVRYSFLPVLSRDLEVFNGPWLEALKGGDMTVALDPELEFDYSPLYLYLWTLAARVLGRFDTYLVLKCLSLAMEAFLTLMCVRLTFALTQSRERRFLSFVMLWLNPVLIWNVSAWGQTDPLYIGFCVLALTLLVTDRPQAGLCVLGVALAWKLQAVFLLPVFLYAWFCHPKRFSLLWFLALPAIWLGSGLPLVPLGFSPLYPVQIYLWQTQRYASQITYNYPNLYALMGFAMGRDGMVDGMISRCGTAMLLCLYGSLAVWLLRRRTVIRSRATFTLLAAWCALCAVFLLPSMHERYGLMGELLLLCWAVAQGGPRAFGYVVWGLLPTLSAYMQYLFKYPFFPLQLGGAMNLLLVMALTWELFRAVRAEAGTPQPA